MKLQWELAECDYRGSQLPPAPARSRTSNNLYTLRYLVAADVSLNKQPFNPALRNKSGPLGVPLWLNEDALTNFVNTKALLYTSNSPYTVVTKTKHLESDQTTISTSVHKTDKSDKLRISVDFSSDDGVTQPANEVRNDVYAGQKLLKFSVSLREDDKSVKVSSTYLNLNLDLN
ncbi:hypothetical protein J6590_025909 [Homalodisca vitripennis]|nr:hypothetical protein J6590_025909 [Homalodisca vitripennis]